MITEKELYAFASIVDECRDLFTKVNVKKELSLKFIFTILYSRMILTVCEISTLLNAGYPEGAMALARSTFETTVLMTYLYDRKEDMELIERFYDDYRVRTCKDLIEYLEWRFSNSKGNENTFKTLQNRKNEYDQLREKYHGFTPKNKNARFRMYWWTGKYTTFHQLKAEVNHRYNYLYNLSCYRVHAGMTGILTLDNTEEGLLIGNCEGGKELPLYFSLLNLNEINQLYFNILGIEDSEVRSKILKLLETIE